MCVWPPHTSMNLNASSPASAVICATSALAVVGSLYSSTNLMVLPRPPAAGGSVGSGATEDPGDDLARFSTRSRAMDSAPAARSRTSSDV